MARVDQLAIAELQELPFAQALRDVAEPRPAPRHPIVISLAPFDPRDKRFGLDRTLTSQPGQAPRRPFIERRRLLGRDEGQFVGVEALISTVFVHVNVEVLRARGPSSLRDALLRLADLDADLQPLADFVIEERQQACRLGVIVHAHLLPGYCQMRVWNHAVLPHEERQPVVELNDNRRGQDRIPLLHLSGGKRNGLLAE